MIRCKGCNRKLNRVSVALAHVKDKKKYCDRRLAADRLIYNKLRFREHYLKKQLLKLRSLVASRTIGPLMTSKIDENNRNSRPLVIECNVNVRVMLATFHLKTGGLDLIKVIAMTGIGGGRNFEKSFSSKFRNDSFMYKRNF